MSVDRIAFLESTPQPWFIVSTNSNIMTSVMRRDYNAIVRRDGYEIKEGVIRKITSREHLYGFRGGTLFVLNFSGPAPKWLKEIRQIAVTRDIKIVDLLHTRRD